MTELETALTKAFSAINKAKMDIENNIEPERAPKHPVFGRILDSTHINIDKVARTNPDVRVRMAYPEHRFSEIILECTPKELSQQGIKQITSIHKLRSSYDPHSPIILILKRRPSGRELAAMKKALTGEGFKLLDMQARRTVAIGGMPFTDPRHLRIYSKNYELVANIPREHNAICIFEAEMGAHVVAQLLGSVKS